VPLLVRIGTRGSQLALAQARWVADHLKRLSPDIDVSMQVIDRHPRLAPDNPLIGDGIFVKEIQIALLNGEVTIGVHSLKDLPTASVQGLVIGAIPSRADPRESLVGSTLAKLPSGAAVGTSSPRRTAQLRSLRPDLNVVPLSGNIPTRIEKVARGECDAAMLAAAGLSRLGLRADDLLPLSLVLPAPGQGALVVEMRYGETELAELLRKIHHRPTAIAVQAERAVLSRLGGGCLLPISALGSVAGARLHLQARVISQDGTKVIGAEAWGDPDEPDALAGEVAENLILRGAWEVLETRV
jgi:hydroxymethylbilane synthase